MMWRYECVEAVDGRLLIALITQPQQCEWSEGVYTEHSDDIDEVSMLVTTNFCLEPRFCRVKYGRDV